MWGPLRDPGLHLVVAPRRATRGFQHDLVADTTAAMDGHVLVCDGDHGLDPYALAEANVLHGTAPDHAADRVLVKRAMTAFQWDSVLRHHLPERLLRVHAALVLVAPLERLLTHEELADWEQEMHAEAGVAALQRHAREHHVPIVALCDLDRLMRTHPAVATTIAEGVGHTWRLAATPHGWRLMGRDVLASPARVTTLDDFVPAVQEAVVRTR